MVVDWVQFAALIAVVTGAFSLGWRAMSASFRRLEVRIDAVASASTTGLQYVATELGSRIDGLDKKVDSLGARLDDKIDSLDKKVDSLGTRLDDKIDSLGTRLDDKIDSLGTRLDDKIDGLDKKVDGLGTRLDEKIDLKVDGLAAIMEARFDTVDHRLGSLESDMTLVKQHLLGRPAA
jgi:hypothetical protein